MYCKERKRKKKGKIDSKILRFYDSKILCAVIVIKLNRI